MAADLENSLRSAAEKVAKYIEDVSTLTVETKYVRVAGDGDVQFTDAKPAARTIVRLDGDSESIIPLRVGTDGQLQIDASLLDLHQVSVQAAIEYRARMLDVLVGILKPRD